MDTPTYPTLSASPTLLAELARLQTVLVVPKSRFMQLGGQKIPYRNAEDITKAVNAAKSEGFGLLQDCEDYRDEGNGAPMLRARSMFFEAKTGSYVATTFTVPVEGLSPQKKGAARSYAIKYALCDLFSVDDGIDDDTLSAATGKLQPEQHVAAPHVSIEQAIADLQQATSIPDLNARTGKYRYHFTNEQFIAAGKAVRAKLTQPQAQQ